MVNTAGYDAGLGADFVRYAHMVAWRAMFTPRSET